MSENYQKRWYIVQTYSGYENKVKANLEQRIATMGMEDRIFSVLVPIEERLQVKDGKTKRIRRKLYPSYVLVEMVLNDQSWFVVRHTPGVTGFVGAGNHPMPLSDKEIQDVMDKIGLGHAKPKMEIDLKPGDVVTVKSGAFEGQSGPVVEVLAEKGKVKFSVTVFGRETVVEADYSELQKL